MINKLLISAIPEGALISRIIKKLNNYRNIELKIHDPLKDSIELKEIFDDINTFDLIIVKVGGASSIDLLYLARINNIPTINIFEAVLICKNKVALDYNLRMIFLKYKNELNNFIIPNSWTYPSPLRNTTNFKDWAKNHLPVVLKSHDQHNEKIRFNFLAKSPPEIDDFLKRFKESLFNDIYIQEFIKCDGLDYKVYVVGDKIFGIERENPIYIYLRDQPDNIEVEKLERKSINLDNQIKDLANILSKELNLQIYGFDLLKSIDNDNYYLIDLNDFPGFKDIENIDEIIVDYILKYLS